MFSWRKWNDGSLEIYELSDGDGTLARFAPARGGMMTEFAVKGAPVLYMDRETLHDTNKNVRGGNPVLFPICGPLRDGKYSVDGREYCMKQHGLARNRAWEVTGTECSRGSARLTMALSSDDSTRQEYPFDFRLVFTYVLEPGRLTIEQQYFNDSPSDMPFYAGFHPYFLAPGGKAVSLYIPTDRYYDIRTGESCQFDGGNPDFTARPETNLVFSDLKEGEAWFAREDGYRVTVSFDGAFQHLVIWALQDRDFLCLEPWMGDNYDMNRGRACILRPGEAMQAVVSYEAKKEGWGF